MVPEHPGQTQVEKQGEKAKDTHIYKVRFSRLGENRLTVNFGKDLYTVLEFFVTQPLETLIKKRAAFIVGKQQHRDPAKWYNGLFSEWDMRAKVLRSPEDTDGMHDYMVASDDPGLCKAPFVAGKNVDYPDAREIEAVEYYLMNSGTQATHYGFWYPGPEKKRFFRAWPKGGFVRSRFVTGTILFLTVAFSVTALAAGPLLFDKSEYAARRARLMEKIPDGVAILLGATPATGYGEFVQNNDMMYFSGVEIPNAALIIDGRSKTSTLFFTITDTGARNEGIGLDLVRNAAAVTGVERVAPVDQFTPTLARLAGSGAVLYTSYKPEELARECSAEKFGIVQNAVTLNLWDGRLTRELQFVKTLRERFPQATVKDATPLIWELRSIKSPAEIDHLRKAGRLGVEAHKAMMRATRVGAPEYEMSAAFEYAVKKAGARDIAYNVIISSAENHPYLHYYRHDRILKAGDFIVVDAGPNLDYYTVDISASYPADGKFTARQREIYEAAQAIEEACLQVYRPGIEARDVQPRILEILKKKGFNVDKDLFKIRTMQTGISHNVGMAVHDVSAGPRGPLRPGMVFACDIYAVFPGEDLGVRVEDTIVITETGCENLTPGMPRTIAEIEAFMRK